MIAKFWEDENNSKLDVLIRWSGWMMVKLSMVWKTFIGKLKQDLMFIEVFLIANINHLIEFNCDKIASYDRIYIFKKRFIIKILMLLI